MQIQKPPSGGKGYQKNFCYFLKKHLAMIEIEGLTLRHKRHKIVPLWTAVQIEATWRLKFILH